MRDRNITHRRDVRCAGKYDDCHVRNSGLDYAPFNQALDGNNCFGDGDGFTERYTSFLYIEWKNHIREWLSRDARGQRIACENRWKRWDIWNDAMLVICGDSKTMRITDVWAYDNQSLRYGRPEKVEFRGDGMSWVQEYIKNWEAESFAISEANENPEFIGELNAVVMRYRR